MPTKKLDLGLVRWTTHGKYPFVMNTFNVYVYIIPYLVTFVNAKNAWSAAQTMVPYIYLIILIIVRPAQRLGL